MQIDEQNEIYQEYADAEAERNGDLYGTEKFRKILAASPVFHFTDPLADYEKRLLERALAELRTSEEWRALEAEDIRWGSPWPMRHMCASELLDRYLQKIQQHYLAEAWHREQIAKCDAKIAELEAWPTQSISKFNRLKHWRERRLVSDMALRRHIDAGHRYERLINKWRGIVYKLHEADIAKEIAAEKRGIGNRYGFNPNMQSRETATEMFEDD